MLIIRRKTESYLKFGLNLVRNSVHVFCHVPKHILALTHPFDKMEIFKILWKERAQMCHC